MKKNQKQTIILASGSAARAAMLRNAGLTFRSIPAAVDEDQITRALRARKAGPQQIAKKLSEIKALEVARKNPRALVIGADQVMVQGKKLIGKARDEKDAARKLKAMRGGKQTLISAVCVAKGGEILWSHVDETIITMRKFSDKTLRAYCAKAGPALTRSVGACEVESYGAWLVEKADGDFFTILGLPLLPLLGYLAEEHGFTP